MQTQKVKSIRSGLPAGVVALLGSAILAPGMAQAVEFEYSGYIREHLSMNLQNSDEFEGKFNSVTGQTYGDTVGGKGELSMWRHSGKLEASADFGPFQIAGVGRIARETRTSYERGLQNATKRNTIFATVGAAGSVIMSGGNPLNPADYTPANLAFTGFRGYFDGAVNGFGAGTRNDLFLEDYDSTELRELYTTFSLGERTHFKLGKQQVVWGETDFFRAMDVIHGYDYRWRSFLELENEELRKPLILANVTIDVPELAGALQIVVRPGWDSGHDVGDTGPINGGRWAPVPWATTGVTSSLIGPENHHHNTGDENDVNYGFRWSGTFKQIGYSLNYWRGIANDGLVVRNPLLGGSTNFGRWEGRGAPGVPGIPSSLTELIHPLIETYGFTFNGYSGLIDSVLRGELAFTPNKPYNTGQFTAVDLVGFLSGGALPVLLNDTTNPASPTFDPVTGMTSFGTPASFVLQVPGLGPVVEKDTLKIMLGVDKNLNWTMNTLGTSRPAFWTMQLFDTWITNYDRHDNILENFGFGAARREHQTFLTNAFTFPYKYDTVTPGIAVGVDLGSFDSFLIPSLDLQYGDHWRVKFEADLFFPTHAQSNLPGAIDTDTRTLGTLHNRDQLVARITYQF
jgi:hypothetical protein